MNDEILRFVEPGEIRIGDVTRDGWTVSEVIPGSGETKVALTSAIGSISFRAYPAGELVAVYRAPEDPPLVKADPDDIRGALFIASVALLAMIAGAGWLLWKYLGG